MNVSGKVIPKQVVPRLHHVLGRHEQRHPVYVCHGGRATLVGIRALERLWTLFLEYAYPSRVDGHCMFFVKYTEIRDH